MHRHEWRKRKPRWQRTVDEGPQSHLCRPLSAVQAAARHDRRSDIATTPTHHDMTDPFYSTRRWREMRAAVLLEQPICATPGCGAATFAVDHIRERRFGGADARSNLRALCESCHNSRRLGREPSAHGCRQDGTPHDPSHWWNEASEPPPGPRTTHAAPRPRKANSSGLGVSTAPSGQRRVSSQKFPIRTLRI
jgi:5-methylcytosine-specific restriction endonuclease McrA